MPKASKTPGLSLPLPGVTRSISFSCITTFLFVFLLAQSVLNCVCGAVVTDGEEEEKASIGGFVSKNFRAATSGLDAIADLGPLCPTYFKVGADARDFFREVAYFTALPVVTELFRSMPLPAMF